jgi:hypothetical protein
MVPASLIAGIVLVSLARTPQAALACAVYSSTSSSPGPPPARHRRLGPDQPELDGNSSGTGMCRDRAGGGKGRCSR